MGKYFLNSNAVGGKPVKETTAEYKKTKKPKRRVKTTREERERKRQLIEREIRKKEDKSNPLDNFTTAELQAKNEQLLKLLG